jgi:parallel beta-helix repeat protein
MRSGPRHAACQPVGPRHVRAPRCSNRGDLSAPSGGRWRRTSLTAVGLVLALIAALTLSANAIGPPAPEPAPAPALLGAGAQADSGTAAAQQEATRRLETAIGRTLNIGHSFVPWGAGLGELPAANLAAGRTPMISFGRDSSPRAVAAGRHDRYLAALARGVAALGRPVLLRYAWGMDTAGRRATRPAVYVAAWRHVHDLFAAQGVHAFWVWSPNADAFAGARGGVDQYWPGDDYVDWVGADGFNRGDCDGQSTWEDFGSMFKAFYSWGSARAKPMMISSTGTVEDPIDPGRKRGWYLDAAATLARSMPRVRAVVVLDQGGRCDWRPDTSPLSVQGFVDFARDPFFTGVSPAPVAPSVTTALPTTTTIPATSTTAVPTTKAPTTTAPPPTTSPANESVPACLTRAGVAISTGNDAQRVVDAHGPGTTYVVKAGSHLRNFSVQPKSGDTYCGEPGAVLDGGRTLKSAFSGQARNVTLDSITVQEYNSGWQGGAIHPDAAASGWVVRNVSALHNYWAGLMAADGMKILGGHYNDNDQLGISGNAATGIVLDGLDGDPSTFDGPEMARNRTLHAGCGYESGGMKWDKGQVTVRNAHVHHNSCRGLWADGNSHDALIEHNLVENNAEEGILYEISQDAVIRNNLIYRNGFSGSGWYWAGGVTVASSFNIEVYGNRLSDNYNGITGTQQDRPDGTPPAHLLDNFQVHDNLICATGGSHPTGVVADNGADLAARDITFSGNTVQAATCRQ